MIIPTCAGLQVPRVWATVTPIMCHKYIIYWKNAYTVHGL